jgi:hypothetical protein
LRDLWQGVGGGEGTSRAALKIDARLELKTGSVDIRLLQGRDSDNRSPHAEAEYQKGTLRIQDLGYFNLSRMRTQSERGEYWLSRQLPRTQIFTENNERVELVALIKNTQKQKVDKLEMWVKVGAVEKLEARLVMWKLPDEVVARRREKMKAAARKKGRTASAENLALAAWNLLITNAKAEKLSFNGCFLLYSLRWQIELLFKLWKSHAKLGHSESKNVQRILCELYAKLLGVLIQHWIVLTGLWKIPERSLVKGCQMIKEQSARLASAMTDLDALIAVLKDISERFEYGCSLNSRKKHPNSSQQLKNGYKFS